MQKDVLQSVKYPEAFFHPAKITGTLKPGVTQTVSAEGAFNIYGVEHPMKLEIEVNFLGNQATLTTDFRVPYVA